MELLSLSTSARKGAKLNLQHKMVQMMYPHMKVNAGLSQADTSNPPRQRCNWLLMLLRYLICCTSASSFFCSLRRTRGTLLHWQECQSMPCVLTLPKHWLPEMNAYQYTHSAAGVCYTQEMQHNSIFAKSALQSQAIHHIVLLA